MINSIKIKITSWFYLLILLPVLGNAQTCQTGKILETTPASQFIDHDDGTVTDNKTKLMWKKCSEGQAIINCDGNPANYTWGDALTHTQALNEEGGYAGYTDWRLPNIKELTSIVEDQCAYPSINLAVFPNTAQDAAFWSSSPLSEDLGSYGFSGWFVTFNDGSADWMDFTYTYLGTQVRLVRGSQ